MKSPWAPDLVVRTFMEFTAPVAKDHDSASAWGNVVWNIGIEVMRRIVVE
jgi:hypothetical protein